MATMGAAPFLLPYLAIRKGQGMGLAQKLGYWPRDVVEDLTMRRPLWYHAVSVGEVMASIPLVQRIKREFPHIPILFSTVTATGNAMALSRIKELTHLVYFPFDYPFIVKKVIEMANPLAFITTETEIWPNFIRHLQQRDIPVILVNGRISPHSFRRYRRFRFFFKEVLDNISLFCMQSHLSAERIAEIGAERKRIIVTGNLKFDQNPPEIGSVEELRRLLSLGEDKEVIIAGSTHRGEEEIIVRAFMELKAEFPDLKLIVAPRAPERFDEVETIIRKESPSYMRRTWLKSAADRGKEWEILLLDTIGELNSIYVLGSIVFIGGSLVASGGHNPLEAVVHRKPVIFGPHMFNFSEMVDALKDSDGCIQVKNGAELTEEMRRLLREPSRREQKGNAAYGVLEAHRGAVERHMISIAPILSRAIARVPVTVREK